MVHTKKVIKFKKISDINGILIQNQKKKIIQNLDGKLGEKEKQRNCNK